jgi:uncharacterized membrane protein YhaH (DUF805 family)
MYWYLRVWKKYAVFSGRARRREYWIFALINGLIFGVVTFIEGRANTSGALVGLFQLIIFIPSLAVAVRRMHDSDHSGWWIFLPIVNLIFLILDSQPGENRFGPNPKTSEE